MGPVDSRELGHSYYYGDVSKFYGVRMIAQRLPEGDGSRDEGAPANFRRMPFVMVTLPAKLSFFFLSHFRSGICPLEKL